MVFLSASRKLASGCAPRPCRIGVSVALALLSLALIRVLPSQAEQWQKLDAQGYIDDFAAVLDPATVEQLTRLCAEVDQKAKAQIALATIRSLEGDPVQDFANHLFQKWGVGYKGTDRGVMVLLAVDDHKYWTEVGYGLEPILPDGKVGAFGRDMVPLLRQRDYNRAAVQIVSQIARVIAQDSHVSLDSLPQSPATPPPNDQSEGQEPHLRAGEIVGLLLILVVLGTLFKLFGPWFLFSLFLGGRRARRIGQMGRWRVWRRRRGIRGRFLRRGRSRRKLVNNLFWHDRRGPTMNEDQRLTGFVTRLQQAVVTNMLSVGRGGCI